jgi:protein-disulfide isomerase
MGTMRLLLFLIPTALLLAQTPALKKTAATTPTQAKNFKETGSPTAPVTMEIYSDYECPHCRAFFLEVMPTFMAEFVNTNRVRVVHRDFPMAVHKFAKLAARYVNAAGHIGKYDVVGEQVFRTQPEWAQNGNIDATVAKVLSPTEMETVRNLVKDDPTLDDTMKQDIAMGTATDHLIGTPTLVIVSRGKRDVIAGGVPYPVLRSYIISKLGN